MTETTTVEPTLDDSPVDDIPPYQRVAESTMIGDLMRVLVDQLKQLDKPWGELREHRQRIILDAVEGAVERAVLTACRHIAARDVDAVLVTLEKVTMQNGKVQGTLSIPPRTEGLHDLADAAVDSADVLIVLPADLEAWSGGERPRATPDQLDLETEAQRKAAEAEAEEAWTPKVEDWVVVLTDTRCRETGMVLEVGDTAIVQSVDEGVVGVELDDKRGLVYLDQGTLGPFATDEEALDPETVGDATGVGAWPVDLEAGDVVLIGANATRGTVLEVDASSDEAVVETELGGTAHATRFPIRSLKRPGDA